MTTNSEITIPIYGMSCQKCVAKISAALQEVDLRVGRGVLLDEARVFVTKHLHRHTAVDHGADSVYVGFKDDTNARHFAGLNFTERTFGKAVDYEREGTHPEIGAEVAIKHNVVPVNRAGSTLILATADPSNIFALDDINAAMDEVRSGSALRNVVILDPEL